jgi:protein subunit release factor B
MELNFARSSGPGGQNVNKVNTKAEVRFNVKNASWLTSEVRERLQQYQSHRINNEGELLVTCQEHRLQSRNKEECMQKLREMIAEASMTPKERAMWVGIGEQTKQRRRDDKRRRGEIKSGRRNANHDDF